MFPNYSKDHITKFFQNHSDRVGGYRCSLGAIMTEFFDVRKDGDERMHSHFRAMNERQNAQRQNDDRALSS